MFLDMVSPLSLMINKLVCVTLGFHISYEVNGIQRAHPSEKTLHCCYLYIIRSYGTHSNHKRVFAGVGQF